METYSTESENYKVIHYHECISFSVERIEELGQYVPLNPYLNDVKWYSYIKLLDKKKNQTIFKVPSPILNNLIVDEENRLVIGFSNIKFNNPYSLIVFDFNGEPICGIKLSMWGAPFPVQESVTNYREWYNETNVEKSASIIKGDNHLFRLIFEGLDKEKHTLNFVDDDYFNDSIGIIDYSKLNDDFDVFEELEKYFNEKEHNRITRKNLKMTLHVSIIFLSIILSVLLFRKILV